MTSHHARRLLASIQQAGRRRTMRWHRHVACLTSNRAADAVNELIQAGTVRVTTGAGVPVHQVREDGESVLIELNSKGETNAERQGPTDQAG